jgi:hypothetical protein
MSLLALYAQGLANPQAMHLRVVAEVEPEPL